MIVFRLFVCLFLGLGLLATSFSFSALSLSFSFFFLLALSVSWLTTFWPPQILMTNLPTIALTISVCSNSIFACYFQYPFYVVISWKLNIICLGVISLSISYQRFFSVLHIYIHIFYYIWNDFSHYLLKYSLVFFFFFLFWDSHMHTLIHLTVS